jgi:hypothetical protein
MRHPPLTPEGGRLTKAGHYGKTIGDVRSQHDSIYELEELERAHDARKLSLKAQGRLEDLRGRLGGNREELIRIIEAEKSGRRHDDWVAARKERLIAELGLGSGPLFDHR